LKCDLKLDVSDQSNAEKQGQEQGPADNVKAEIVEIFSDDSSIEILDKEDQRIDVVKKEKGAVRRKGDALNAGEGESTTKRKKNADKKNADQKTADKKTADKSNVVKKGRTADKSNVVKKGRTADKSNVVKKGRSGVKKGSNVVKKGRTKAKVGGKTVPQTESKKAAKKKGKKGRNA